MACTLVPLEDSVCALRFVIPSYELNVTGLRRTMLEKCSCKVEVVGRFVRVAPFAFDTRALRPPSPINAFYSAASRFLLLRIASARICSLTLYIVKLYNTIVGKTSLKLRTPVLIAITMHFDSAYASTTSR